jgi:hypothetical protein
MCLYPPTNHVRFSKNRCFFSAAKLLVGLNFIAAFQNAGFGSGRDFKPATAGNAENQNMPAAQKLSIPGTGPF